MISQAAVGYPCIGSQVGEHRSLIWFTPWFLSVCHIEAPACVWQRDGRKITKTMKADGRQRIWMLTDKYDHLGRRLGVWPD